MKILILHNSALGDFVTFLPFLKLLLFNYKDAKINIFTNKNFFCFFNEYKNVDYFNIELVPLFKLFNQNTTLSNFYFLKEYDFIISFVGTENQIFKKNILQLNKNTFFIFPHNKFDNIHQVFYLINSYPFKKIRFFYPNIKIRNKKKKFFIIHPGSGSKIKNVPINFLKRIELEIIKNFNLKSIWIGGEAEENLKYKINNLKLLFSIEELIDYFSEAYFYIGNDSGASHLAAACNILTFTFFGPTSPKIWSPLGKKSIVLYRNLKCSPCKRYCNSRECLNFSFKDVKNIILKKIEQEINSCSIKI